MSLDKIARVWAISGERLQAAIRSATNVCLDPPFRKRYFGDLPEEARSKYQICGHANGRSGTYARRGIHTTDAGEH